MNKAEGKLVVKDTGKKKKQAVFRPTTTSRLLLGPNPMSALKADLKYFNLHRYNIFTAKSRIDSSPPKMNPYHFFNLKKFEKDNFRLQEIQKENKKLLCKINTINRTKGSVDCWNVNKPLKQTKWLEKVAFLKMLFQRNQELYMKLCLVGPVISRQEHLKDWKRNFNMMKYTAKFPLLIFDTKTVDQMVREQPSITSGIVSKVIPIRPKVYMDFKIPNGICLGEIIIELYIDHAPNTVKNFLAICNSMHGLTYKNCRIHNGVKGQYFETGDITMGNGKGGTTIYGDSFFEERNILMHSKQGVVSSVRVKQKEKYDVPKINSMFSITFGPMLEMDSKRSVFGKVIRGNEVLCKINDICKKIGTPIRPVVICKCGEIPLTKDEIRRYIEMNQNVEVVE